MCSVTLEDILQPGPDVLFQSLDGEAVLLQLRTGKYFGLNGLGAEVWKLLDTHEPVRSILTHLVETYKVPSQQIEYDLLAFLSELIAHRLVEPHAS